MTPDTAPNGDQDRITTTAAPPLTNDERLTLLRHALRSVLVTNGGEYTIWDRLLDVGVPVDELLADAPPFSAPPYSREAFERMRKWPK